MLIISIPELSKCSIQGSKPRILKPCFYNILDRQASTSKESELFLSRKVPWAVMGGNDDQGFSWHEKCASTHIHVHVQYNSTVHNDPEAPLSQETCSFSPSPLWPDPMSSRWVVMLKFTCCNSQPKSMPVVLRQHQVAIECCPQFSTNSGREKRWAQLVVYNCSCPAMNPFYSLQFGV